MINKGSYIRCLKLNAVTNAPDPTPSIDDFILGEHNPGKSVPNDYWVTGTLLKDIAVGDRICIARDVRNGIRSYGSFTSSEIENIDQDGENLKISTLNSVYLLQLWENSNG
jgi:hypothetical protein